MQKKFIFNLFIFHTGISKNEAAQYNEVDNIYRKGFLSKVKFMTGNQDVIETVEKNSKELAIEIEKELPAAEYEHIQEQDYWIEMPDGIRLYARVTMPEKEGKWPVILTRTPYAVVDISERYLTVAALAKRGYAVVYNHVRGTIASEGEWLPFEYERSDGRAVVDWIGKQPWCNGNIGTMGGSYMGHVQWSVADYQHPMLKTMFISVYGPHPYHIFYRRGMFRQDIWTGWAATMLQDNRYRCFSQIEEAELRKKAYGVRPQAELGEQMKQKECEWYKNWTENIRESDPYWSEGFWKELEESVKDIKIPLFLHGGWFDIFLRSQLDVYHRLSEDVRNKSCFMIGPWCHTTKPGGPLEYPNENRAGILYIKAALEWFDYQLKGKENVHPLGKVEAYCIGDNQWNILDDTSLSSGKEIFYMNLEEKSAGKLQKQYPKTNESVKYVYDPAEPVQSCGGTLLFNIKDPLAGPDCSTYQPDVGSREDVISLISDTFSENLYIMGAIKTHLFVSSNASATAFTIKVMEVFADGKCVNIIDDITDIRWRNETDVVPYEPNSIVELVMEMNEIHWMLKSGSKLRIDISSSNFPAYHIHPNVEEIWSQTKEIRIAEQTVYSGPQHLSRIEIPVK